MSQGIKTPIKPEPPHPDECCGGGCVPCVYDYYEIQLQKWHERVEQLQNSDGCSE